LPRGLGESPLSRAKKGRKSRAAGSASSAPTTGNESAGGQSFVESAVASGASHNDVFFQRRVDETTPVFENDSGPHEVIHYGEVATATEIPEIAEVTDIVRIAEVTQSANNAPLLPEVAQLPEPQTIAESAPPALEAPVTVIDPVPSEAQGEEPVAAVEPAPPEREEKEERAPEISDALQPVTKGESKTPPESEKSKGFFKRLFGRFGK
jgi:hypothetical protein